MATEYVWLSRWLRQADLHAQLTHLRPPAMIGRKYQCIVQFHCSSSTYTPDISRSYDCEDAS